MNISQNLINYILKIRWGLFNFIHQIIIEMYYFFLFLINDIINVSFH